MPLMRGFPNEGSRSHGPNLGRLDIRDSSIYGDMTYPVLVSHIEGAAKTHGFDADVRQSNDEAEIIGWLHEAADTNTPVIINPAAFTHYSYAIRDAAELVKAPLIEVHLIKSTWLARSFVTPQ